MLRLPPGADKHVHMRAGASARTMACIYKCDLPQGRGGGKRVRNRRVDSSGALYNAGTVRNIWAKVKGG